MCHWMQTGFKVEQQGTKSQNIFPWWHIFIDFNWNAICHSLTLSRDTLNVNTASLRWPGSLPSITANYSRRAEIEESRGKLDHYLKCSIAAGHQSCDPLLGRRTSDDVFLVSLSSFSENLCMHRHGNPVLSALWHHISPHPFSIWWLSVRTSKVVLIVLMIMCHSDVSHVRPRAGLPARRQGDATGQCSVVLE